MARGEVDKHGPTQGQIAPDLFAVYYMEGSRGSELCFSADDPKRLCVHPSRLQAYGEMMVLWGRELARGVEVDPRKAFQIVQYKAVAVAGTTVGRAKELES